MTMIESANQLIKYKKLLKKLEKDFPKQRVEYTGFTIDVSYGGNKEADLKRIIISKSLDDSSAQELLDIVVKSVRVQIDFWERVVLQDIKNLEKALK